jgi:hypothetical protein
MTWRCEPQQSRDSKPHGLQRSLPGEDAMLEAVSVSFSEDLETKDLQKAARVLKQLSISFLGNTHVEILRY